MRAPLLAAVPVGLAAGSVAGAALTRWPAGVTLGRPARSRCDACAAPIAAVALVPVLGWLVRRGRCGACGVRIDVRQPALEGLGAVLVVGALAVPPTMVGLLLGGVGVVLILAAALDLAHRWVPDRLTLPAGAVVLPVALGAAVVRGDGGRDVLLHGLALPAVLEAVRRVTAAAPTGPWLGGGDVKLLVPVLAAAATVPSGPLLVWTGALASGGAVAALGLATGRIPRGGRLPFVPFLALGWATLLVVRLTGGAT